VMDVAMSISSSMFELASVSSKLTTRELIRSGMNVGTDMIGTMTNTLILALAGGSLSTVILIYSAAISELQLVNLDVLGTELIQGIAGSIGIVITVPITVLIGAYMCIKKK
ncbi:MAG: YibE/F family protein, partial [Turicibacter sp.]